MHFSKAMTGRNAAKILGLYIQLAGRKQLVEKVKSLSIQSLCNFM